MKPFRWVLIALVALYTLMALMPVLSTLMFKLGLHDPSLALAGPEGAEAMRALMVATNPPVLIAWVVMAALYVLGLLRFVRRQSGAWRPLLLAWALDVAVVLMMQTKPAYQAFFTPEQQQFTWVLLIVSAALVAAVGWFERGARLRTRRALAA